MNAIDQFTLLDTQQIIDKIGKIPIENFKYLRLDQIIDLIGKIEYKTLLNRCYTIYTAMEIVKAFNSNDLHANITIKGTYI